MKKQSKGIILFAILMFASSCKSRNKMIVDSPLVIMSEEPSSLNLTGPKIFIGISDTQIAKFSPQKIAPNVDKKVVVHNYNKLNEFRDSLDYADLNSRLENGRATIIIPDDDVPEFRDIVKRESSDFQIDTEWQSEGITSLSLKGLTPLERSAPFRSLNVRVETKSSLKIVRMDLNQNGKKCGYISISLDRESFTYTHKPGTSLGETIDPNRLAYLTKIEIEEAYRGKGLAYPLLCHAFKMIKETYGKEFIYLMNQSTVRDLYTKMGFRMYSNDEKQRVSWEVGKIDTILANEKCAGFFH